MIGFFKFPLENSLGGGEYYTLQAAQYFIKHGEKIHLFTSDKLLYRLFCQHSLPATLVQVGPEPTSKIALLFWPLTYLRAQLQFRRILKNMTDLRVVFLHSLTEKIILTSILEKKNHPAIYWVEHKIPGRWFKKNPLRFYYRAMAKKINGLITVSKFAAEKWREAGIAKEKIIIIPPGVELHPLGLTPLPTFTIGLLSRLEKEKGILKFLQVVSPYLRRHRDWRVEIGGEGSEKSQVLTWLNQTKLESQITLFGHIDNRQNFFKKLSVFAFPALSPESFGLSACEAQSYGIPVVATKIGALPETVGEGGILIEAEEQWGPAFERLYSDQSFYTEKKNQAFENARNFSVEKFDSALDKLSSIKRT